MLEYSVAFFTVHAKMQLNTCVKC